MQTTNACTRATTFLTITLLLACAIQASASDSTIVITNTGSAVASWYTAEMGYDNFSLKDSKWAATGGIVLGSGILYSRPTYTFYLPQPQVVAGAQELTELTVKIYGVGSLIGSAHVQIGSQTVTNLATTESQNVYSFTGASARSLLTPIGRSGGHTSGLRTASAVRRRCIGGDGGVLAHAAHGADE